jgi:hypothetical protein
MGLPLRIRQIPTPALAFIHEFLESIFIGIEPVIDFGKG